MPIRARPTTVEDIDAWTAMRAAMWSDAPAAEHRQEIERYLTSGQTNSMRGVCLIAERDGLPVGFLEASVKSLDGFAIGKVPYIEGIFVEPASRRLGVCRALVNAFAAWARQSGFFELASGVEIDNDLSQAAHRALGFEPVTSHLIYRKSLVPKSVTRSYVESDVVSIRSAILPIEESVSRVLCPASGGIDVFLGTTRSEARADGVELLALDYEAYAEMALAQMHALVATARGRWPIARCALLHRVGRVAVGEASVLIAVSCPHRGQAFEACRFLIDELKKSVTIWKREVWADESSSWVHPSDPPERGG